ncbi:MAG: hypothetical protein K0S18_1762 [Anaerocolumna sp.]|nr:hypothetical protein [Anaerocolumna sp.]
MTNCKSCNKEISVGMEYCDECEKKNQDKSNESYLDSLLNSVSDSRNIVQTDHRITSDNSIDELNMDSEGNQLLDYTTEENNYKGNNYNNNYEDTTIKDKEQTNLNNINNDVFDLEESEKETTESQDDDLMALLDMITGLENSDSNKYDDVPITEDEESLSLEEDNEMLSKSTPQDRFYRFDR